MQYEVHGELKSFSFDPKQAIINTVHNNINAESTKEKWEVYRTLILTIWTGDDMQSFINSIDYDEIKKSIIERFIGREFTQSESKTIKWIEEWEIETKTNIFRLIKDAYENEK